MGTCPKCGGSTGSGNHHQSAANQGPPSGYTNKPANNPKYSGQRFESRSINVGDTRYKTTTVYNPQTHEVADVSSKSGRGFLTGMFKWFR